MTTNRKSRRKGLLTGLASLTAVSAIAVGSFAAFSSSDTATQEINTGSGDIVFDAAGRASIETPINNLLPGDSVTKTFVIENSATFVWGSVQLDVAGGNAGILTTDAVEGLQVVVDECSVAYAANVCSGTETNKITSDVAAGPGSAANIRLTGAAGSDGYYRVTLELPAAATNATANQSDTVVYTFTAAQ